MASVYTVESYYSVGGSVQYYGSGRITAATNAYVQNTYYGNSTYRSQFETVAKNTALLCLEASNRLLKTYTNMTAADLGFVAFK